jgi:hypothetical protein
MQMVHNPLHHRLQMAGFKKIIPLRTSIKVKFSLCLTNYTLCHEGVLGSGCIDPHFLTSTRAEGEWLASRPCHFTPGERPPPPGTQCIGSWVGPRADLDNVQKVLDPTGIQTPTPRSSNPQPVAIPTTLSGSKNNYFVFNYGCCPEFQVMVTTKPLNMDDYDYYYYYYHY